MYLVFTRMPGESYRGRFMSSLLCLCDVFRALITSLVLRFPVQVVGKESRDRAAEGNPGYTFHCILKTFFLTKVTVLNLSLPGVGKGVLPSRA